MAKDKTPAAPRGLSRVRTTFNPDKVIEVDAAEHLDLKRQGLIHEAPAPASADTNQEGAES